MFKKTILMLLTAMMFNLATKADDKNGDERDKEQRSEMKIIWLF